MDQRSAAPERIARETSRIAECVKNGFVLRIVLDERAVVSLVNEETCFLPTEPVNVKLQTIFSGKWFNGCVRMTDEIAIVTVISDFRLVRQGGG